MHFAPEIAEIGRLCTVIGTRVEGVVVIERAGGGHGMCPELQLRKSCDRRVVRDRRTKESIPPLNPDDRVKKTNRGYRCNKRPPRVGAFIRVQPSLSTRTAQHVRTAVHYRDQLYPFLFLSSYTFSLQGAACALVCVCVRPAQLNSGRYSTSGRQQTS